MPKATALSVLVVDDSPDCANALCELLSMLGHRCQTADSCLEAMRAISALVPDLIFLDLQLPDGFGGDLLPRLLAATVAQGTRIVVYSGTCDIGTRRRMAELGASAFIAKPMSPAELDETLAACRACAASEPGLPTAAQGSSASSSLSSAGLSM